MTTRAQPRRFQSIGSSSTGADKSSAVQGTNADEVERPRPLEAWNALAHHVITVEAGKVRIGVHGAVSHVVHPVARLAERAHERVGNDAIFRNTFVVRLPALVVEGRNADA